MNAVSHANYKHKLIKIAADDDDAQPGVFHYRVAIATAAACVHRCCFNLNACTAAVLAAECCLCILDPRSANLRPTASTASASAVPAPPP